MSPNRVVPTLVVNGRVFIESTPTNEFVDTANGEAVRGELEKTPALR